MNRSLRVAALSALFFLLTFPALAQPAAPVEGENTPIEQTQPSGPVPVAEPEPPLEEIVLTPATPLDACLAAASAPEGCEGVPDTPVPVECAVDGGSLPVCGGEPEVDGFVQSAAAMAAEEAAEDAIAGQEGVVQGAAAFDAALGAARQAARRAARDAGADEAGAEVAAERAAAPAAANAVAEKAVEEAASGEGSGAVEGAAAYVAALGAAREAGAEEEVAPFAAARAVANVSEEEPDDAGDEGDATKYGATSSGTNDSGETPGAGREEMPAADTEDAAEDSAAVADSGTVEGAAVEVEESPLGYGGPAGAVAGVLPAAKDASPLVLGAGALLVAAGVVVLVRRRVAL